MKIIIADQYTKTPGGRYKNDGKYSGEEFRETLLKPAFLKCKERKEELIVDLDGGYGYGSSFLDESFGGLARQLRDPEMLNIKIISDEEPEKIDQVKKYIQAGLEYREEEV